MTRLSHEQLHDGGTVAILLHPAGSSNKTDGGRDAASYEAKTGIRTIGVDRPGSGLWLPRLHKVKGLDEYTDKLTDAIDATLKKQGLADAERLVLLGRSAGGLAAIVGASETTYHGVPVAAVYAGEPIGTYEIPVSKGQATWTGYKKTEYSMIADTTGHPDLVRPDPTDTRGLERLYRLAAMAPFFLNDQRYGNEFWAQAPLEESIGRVSTGTLVAVDFASTSMVLPQDEALRASVYADIAAQLQARNDGSSVGIAENTTHRSFDQRAFFATQSVQRLTGTN